MCQLPAVSVIIPTYNRHVELVKTLDALSRQTLSPSEFEVVVVDDGSTDATPQIANLPHPFRLNYVRQHNQGGVAARNRGATISGGELLVFIDDDISFDPGYLEAILGAHQWGEKVAGMGVFLPFLTGQDSIFAAVYAPVIPARMESQADQFVPFVECASNNLAIESKDFLDIGLWNDVLGGGPGIWGDVDFGYRAWVRGFKFLRVADAKLLHRDHTILNLQAACKRSYYISSEVHLLFQHSPEIRQYLPMFRDKPPVAVFSDSPPLIARKVLRMAASSPLALCTMESVVHILETKAAQSFLLVRLYRWIISAYIYKGYRQGLRDLDEATT